MGAVLSGWTPPQAPAPSWSPARRALPSAPRPLLGQAVAGAKEAPIELVISFITAGGAMVGGFALALMASEKNTTWKWIGGISGTIGVMKLLQLVTKLG
jgi:hypothetical protein